MREKKRFGFGKQRGRKSLVKTCTGVVLAAALLLTGWDGDVFMEGVSMVGNVSPKGTVFPFGNTVPLEKVSLVKQAQAVTKAQAAGEDTEEENAGEEDGEDAGLLDDTNGRISFWKWEKVTPKNWKDYFKDGKFHASMFVRYADDEGKNPKGFISLYADKQHVYKGYNVGTGTVRRGFHAKGVPDWETLSSSKLEKLSPLGSLYDGGGTEVDMSYSSFFLLDDQGNSLNDHKEYFKKDTFYTIGDSMGVLWLQYIKDSETVSTKTVDGRSFAAKPYHGENDADFYEFPNFHVALSRSDMKNQPDNESYLDIGSGKETDYYLEYGIVELEESGGTRLRRILTLGTYYDKDALDNMPGLVPWKCDWNSSGWMFKVGSENLIWKDGWGLP